MNPAKNTLSSLVILTFAAGVAFSQGSNDPDFDLSNTNGYFYFLLAGKNKCDRKDCEVGITLLTKAIQLKPKQIDPYAYRAWAEYSKGDYDKAIADYTKCVELQPDNFNPYIYRGFAKEKKGDHDGAIADFTAIIKHEHDPTELLIGAHDNRGHSKIAKGDLAGAALDFNEILELKPSGPSADFFISDARNEIEEIKKPVKK